MTDVWAAEAARTIQQQLDARDHETARLWQDERVRAERAPLAWAEVQSFVTEKCAALNGAVGDHLAEPTMVNANQLRVRLAVSGVSTREVTATFRPDSLHNVLGWKSSGHTRNQPQSADYELAVEDGEAVLRANVARTETPEEIAEHMLNALLLE